MNIKIRGYHTEQKRMYSPEELASDQLTLLTTGNFINVHGSNTSFSTIYPRDKFIPLLYTGKNDDDGKEIYDGDILLVDDISLFNEDVHVSVGMGGYGKLENWPGLWMVGNMADGSNNHMPLFDLRTCKLIGNIYQNTELLIKLL